jgi:aminoglycoside phosphotransferase (APT) family kinase protein
MQFGAQTSALVTMIEGLVVGLQTKALPKTDLVHGDLTISQVLFDNNKVSGVVDWDQVGYGDRTQDYVALWYSLVDFPDTSAALVQHMKTVSDGPAIKIHAAYRMLSDVAATINKAGADVEPAVARAWKAIDQIRGLA